MLVCSFFALVFHPLFLSFGFDFYTETPFIVLHIVLTYIIVGTLIWMWAGKRVWWKQGLSTLVKRNWLLGLRIQHEVLKDKRAEYGKQVIKELSNSLTQRYGEGFKPANLYHFVSFYNSFRNIFYAVSRESEKEELDSIFYAVSGKSGTTPQYTAPLEIMNAVRSKSPIRLSWTHYRIILQEPTEEGRAWYENEAAREGWGTRALQRNVSSQYYHRLLQSQDKALVHDEMQTLTRPLQDKLEYLKNPVVAEFMGFKNNATYTESELEQSIIDHLIPFLMELGKGFAFVDRQKHIGRSREVPCAQWQISLFVSHPSTQQS